MEKNDKSIVEMYELYFSPVSQKMIINALPCLYVFIQNCVHLYRDRYKYIYVYHIACCQYKPVISNVNIILTHKVGQREVGEGDNHVI